MSNKSLIWVHQRPGSAAVCCVTSRSQSQQQRETESNTAVQQSYRFDCRLINHIFHVFKDYHTCDVQRRTRATAAPLIRFRSSVQPTYSSKKN